MKRFFFPLFWCVSFFLTNPVQILAADFTEVKPGVFFRVCNSGCNNGWIVFKDYVLVIDGNFPAAAEETVQMIRQSTGKPIRFLFDTHNHGDHIFGNAVFAREGATVIATRGFFQKGRQALQTDFDEWAKTQSAKDIHWVEPSILFDDRLVLDDGERRVELLSYGHGHNPGDAVAYLPKEKILYTGDLCVNGVFNYLGDANLERWIEILESLQGLDVETVCPGHGSAAGKELLQTQKDYLIQLRDRVQDGIESGKTTETIAQEIQIPLFEKWTNAKPPQHNIRDAYRILTGLSVSWDLLSLGLAEGPSPTRDTPGWTPPRRMLTRGLSERQLAELHSIAPDMEFTNVRSGMDDLPGIEEADAMMGPISPTLFKAASKLRWVHSRTAGIEDYLFPEFVEGTVVLTNAQGTYGPAIADQVIAYMLMLSKSSLERHANQMKNLWKRDTQHNLQDLEGKTVLILGLGGIGRQIAKRAVGFGMIVRAVDPQSMEKPQYVQAIVPPGELHNELPRADFVASTVPLTPHTNRYFDKSCFTRMKSSAYFINVGRGQTVNQDDLVQALQNKTIAGAALDVFDPEPLPSDYPLWKMENVIITPHVSGHSEASWDRSWLLLRENVRRFANGLPLLNVVDKKAGY